MKIERPQSKQPIPEDAKMVFKGKLFEVYQWEQELFDGKKVTFEKLKRPDTALVVPVTEENQVILSFEEQPGSTAHSRLLGGRIDEGENPFDAAQRELLEETGMQAKEWHLLYAFQPVIKVEWSIYIFVAKGCKKVEEPELDGGEKIELREMDFDKFIEVVCGDDFSDNEFKMRVLEARLDPRKMIDFKNIITN